MMLWLMAFKKDFAVICCEDTAQSGK